MCIKPGSPSAKLQSSWKCRLRLVPTRSFTGEGGGEPSIQAMIHSLGVVSLIFVSCNSAQTTARWCVFICCSETQCYEAMSCKEYCQTNERGCSSGWNNSSVCSSCHHFPLVWELQPCQQTISGSKEQFYFQGSIALGWTVTFVVSSKLT